MDIFQSYKELQLTGDQKLAIEAIGRFLVSSDSVFLLNGYAGTGKTTLLKGLCHYLKTVHRPFKLMTPTGRAAMVLHQRTLQEASTIHRAIYNMERLLEKKEGTSFKYYYQLAVNSNAGDTVYMVDEASMISDFFNDNEFFVFGSGRLLRDLLQFTLGNEGRCKIIFVGDDAQLPPVQMNFSPALSKHYLLDKYGVTAVSVSMKQVVRQAAASGILQSATRIRDALEKKVFNSFDLTTDNGDVIKLASNNFANAYKHLVKTGGIKNCMVITHSNLQALYYNEVIREMRYGHNGFTLQNSDLLIITHNNYNGSVTLFNGTFARVLTVGEIIYKANPRFIVEGGKSISRSLTFREVLLEVANLKGEPEPIKTTILDNFLTSPAGALHSHDQRALYIDFKNRMHERGIKSKDAAFRQEMKRDLYFNAVQAKYGYAITCHKSQGGEWPNVLVDFNVFTGQRTSGFFRWAYTAVTRAGRHLTALDVAVYNPLTNYIVKDILKLSAVLSGMYPQPATGEAVDFVNHRVKRLQKIAEEQDIEVFFEYYNYQVVVTLKRNSSVAVVRLWYSNKGFSHTVWEPCTDPGIKALARTIVFESLLSDEVPFTASFPFQLEMKKFFTTLLMEENITLTNIVQKEWCDQYYFKTRADCALVEFWYNASHFYTFAWPKSTLGRNDEMLKRIVDKLNVTS